MKNYDPDYIAFEERAAIIEYYDKVDRPEAERRDWKVIEGRAEEPEQMTLIEPEYKKQLRDFYRRY